MKKGLLVLFLTVLSPLFGQNRQLDSLNALLSKAKADTARLRLYVALTDACDVKDNLKYGLPGLKIIDKLLLSTKDSLQRNSILDKQTKLKVWIAEYYQKIEGDALKRLQYLKDALADAEKLQYKRGMSRYIVQLEFMYADLGDTAQALYYLDKAVKLEKEIADTSFSRLAKGMYITGVSYEKMKRYDLALNYYNQALQKFESKRDTGNIMKTNFNIAAVLIEKKKIAEALLVFQKNLKLAQLSKDFFSEFISLLQLGNTYRDQGQFDKAIEQHTKALKLGEGAQEEMAMFESGFSLGQDYAAKKDFKKAKEYSASFTKVLDKELPLDIKRDISNLAYKIDSALGNSKDAFKYYQLYITIKEKLNNNDIHKKTDQEKFQRSLDKQNAEQQRKDAITAEESKKQKLITGAIALGLWLVLVFAIFVMRSLRITRKQKQIIELKSKETEEQKQIIEEKQREVLDSIRYASRIQRALITSDKYIETQFKRLNKN